MRCVITLPSEILQSVLLHLPPSEKAALSRVCRSLYIVVSAALYKCIAMRWDTGLWRPPPPPPIHHLLRTSLEHPELARFVASVRFVGSKNNSIWGQGTRWHHHLTQDELARVTLAIAMDLPEHPPGLFNTPTEDESWLRLVAKGHTELYQALLILQLPNLSHLTIGYDSHMSFTYLSYLMKHVLCFNGLPRSNSTLTHLQQVDLCTEPLIRNMDAFMAGYQHSLREVLPFFYLPSLRVLRVVVPRASRPVVWPTVPPCSQTLVTLQLLRTELEPHMLKSLLSVTPMLTNLDFDLVVKTRFQIQGAPYLHCNLLTSALSPVAKSLVSLTISIQIYGENETWYEDPDSMMAIEGVLNFAQLERLQRFEVPLILLLGAAVLVTTTFADRLPASLRNLAFNDDVSPLRYLPMESY